MRSIKLAFLAMALLLGLTPLAACGVPSSSTAPTASAATSTPTPTQKVEDPGPDIQPMAFIPADALKPAISKSLGAFSLDLFQRMTAEGGGKNVFLSPLSVWLALSMTYNGASAGTAEGMAKALHAAGISLDDLNADNAGLMGLLTAADPKVQVAIANSIWMRNSFAPDVNADFLERNRQSYAAGVEALDFAKDSAAGTMNRWVEDHTNGNIKDLIQPPIHPDTVMFLINAVHFKAPWKQAFDPKLTRDGTFATAGGGQTQAKYLFREEGNLGYADESVTAARIPYATGRLEMVAILPRQQALGDYVNALTTQKLDEIISKCAETSLPLLFPKFKIEYEAELNGMLKAMGMEQAFGGSADFSALSAKRGKELYISQVKHKSFIEVNEQGTEASAATSVEIRTEAAVMPMEFNQPFLYLIRDSKTGAILFIGTMENPA